MSDMSDTPFFTIFIPTYNRGYSVGDTIKSCFDSTFTDFEVLIIDDGSKDETGELVKQLQQEVSAEIRYVYQENQGKHVAFNTAVSLAKGKLFLTLDSDDTLLENGLKALYDLWQDMSEDQKQSFASIEFRCLENGVASSAYPEPFLDSTYVAKRLICESKGEKRSAYRTEVLKDFPYPVFPGERYSRPGLIDIRIARKYQTRFSNIIVINAGHFPDGIGANRRQVIKSAPNAYRQYFLEVITNHAKYFTSKDLRSYYKRYSRSSFNAGIGIRQQFNEVPEKLTLLLTIPETWGSSFIDRKLSWLRK
jgi:glycosyltransferase involved in cell wall biosynthesis